MESVIACAGRIQRHHAQREYAHRDDLADVAAVYGERDQRDGSDEAQHEADAVGDRAARILDAALDIGFLPLSVCGRKQLRQNAAEEWLIFFMRYTSSVLKLQNLVFKTSSSDVFII